MPTLSPSQLYSTVVLYDNSVAPIIELVIGKTIYRLVFLYIGIGLKKAADTDMCMYSKIHDHVHQMMFTNAFNCISCITNVVITTSVYC